jgi:hypothetical protein
MANVIAGMSRWLRGLGGNRAFILEFLIARGTRRDATHGRPAWPARNAR